MFTFADLEDNSLLTLLARYAMKLVVVPDGEPIPGSHWGDPEAGLVMNSLFVRNDTPLHSALHEACHYICMDDVRRDRLHTDAGGDYLEENAVCYLQIILADFISGFGCKRSLQDMDDWGYSFRLGSAEAWFEEDAEEALSWLLEHEIVDQEQRPTWNLRH